MAAALVLGTGWLAADELPATGKEDPRLASFDRMMVAFIKDQGLPGGSIAVAKDGRLVYARGFGYADVEKQEPVEPDSLFRIASISKPITAAAVLQLVEQGKIKLDEKIFEIVDFKPHLKPGEYADPRLNAITIRHLLSHTAGWDRDRSFDPMFRPVDFAKALGEQPPANQDAVIRCMMGYPVDFVPGNHYSYSNLGYCLLGRAIEKRTGLSYERYVQDNVLAPIGIKRMQIGRTRADGRVQSEAKYYDGPGTARSVFGDAAERVPFPYGGFHLEAMDSHGGWIASAVDLVRFGSAFNLRAEAAATKATSAEGADDSRPPARLSQHVLRRETIDEMFARPDGPAGYAPDGTKKRAYYGLGWMGTVPEGSKRANMWHTGSLPGTSTILVLRNDGLTWAVLFNSRRGRRGAAPSGAIDPLVHRAADEVAEWPPEDRFEEFLGSAAREQ